MAVAVKKYKLFKICKELNVGMDIVERRPSETYVMATGSDTPSVLAAARLRASMR